MNNLAGVPRPNPDPISVTLDALYRCRYLADTQPSGGSWQPNSEGIRRIARRAIDACLLPLLTHQEHRYELEMREDAADIAQSLSPPLMRLAYKISGAERSFSPASAWIKQWSICLEAASEYATALSRHCEVEVPALFMLQERWDDLSSLVGQDTTETVDPVRGAMVRFGVRDYSDLQRLLPPAEVDAFRSAADPDGTRRRLVLLGAGASVDAGLPDARSLDAEIRALSCPLYRCLSAILDGQLEQCVQMLQLIGGDGEGDNGVGERFGSSGGWHLLEQRAMLGPGGASAQAKDELRMIRDWIRAKYWLNDQQEVTDKCAYLRPLIEAQMGSTIATLNYDNSLDRAGWVVSTDSVPDDDVSLIWLHPWRTRVLPLHGSLAWEERSDERGLVRVVLASLSQDPADLAYPYTPGIIFGAGNKLRPFGPYQDLLSEFQDELFRSMTLITIGYSWNDPHINSIIRRWISADQGFPRSLVVGTGPNTGDLPDVPRLWRVHYGDRVQIHPERGRAPEVIQRLFVDGPYASPHLDSYQEFTCSS